MYTTIGFGKYQGAVLPDVFAMDPNYCFWGVENGMFKGALAKEGRALLQKAANIKIPRSDPQNWRVDYCLDPNRNVISFMALPAATPSSPFTTERLDRLDLVFVHRSLGAPKEKNNDLILNAMDNFFACCGRPLPRASYRAFFDNPDNFIL